MRLGLESLAVAAVYHSVRAFAPRLRGHRVVTADAGTYFEPDRRLYGEIEPLVASRPGSAAALAHCIELARAAGVALRAWLVLTHSSPVGSRHPDHTVENAFGDRYVHALCTSSEAVRRYVSALVADVVQHGVTRIDLEAFGSYGYAHGSHHDKPRADLSPAADALLSLCFCHSCTAAYAEARVDVERLRDAAGTAIDAEVSAPSAGVSGTAALARLPDGLKAVEVRAQACLDTLAAIRRAAGDAVELNAIGTAAPLGVGDPMAAGDARVGPYLDGLVVPVYGLEPENAAAELERVSALTGLPVAAGVRIVAPDGGAERLRRTVQAAAEVGVTSFRHYHLGLATAAELDALGGAVAG